MSVSDWVIACCTVAGPILAVQAQKLIESSRARTIEKRQLFHVLMATRALRAGSPEHVKALNLIDLYFHSKKRGDRRIREAWSLYFDYLSQQLPQFSSEHEATSYNEKSIDLMVELLSAMATELGYEQTKVQLKRGAYYPRGHFDETVLHNKIQKGLSEVLSGERPVSMSVKEFPVSAEALALQEKVQRALIDVLSGDKSLKVHSSEIAAGIVPRGDEPRAPSPPA